MVMKYCSCIAQVNNRDYYKI